MSLRQNALLLAVLTAVIAIGADWSDSPSLQILWRLPAGLLLLGLAYEIAWVRRAAVQLAVATDAHPLLGRAMSIRFEWRHALRRTVSIEYAPVAPDAVSIDSTIRIVRVFPETDTSDTLSITPRQLGTHTWPKIK